MPIRSSLLAAFVALAWSCAAGENSSFVRPAPPRRPIGMEVPPDLATAEERWRSAPADLDAIVWYGRHTAYEGRYADAVAIYTEGLRRHPANAELLRHRGHRFLSLRRFAAAARDLEEASRGIAGTPDAIELDGLPNAHGVPRSTLHTNVWYHLGLAYHCMGEDERAGGAFRRALALSPNDDMRVACAYWTCITLIHLGQAEGVHGLAAVYATRELELMEAFDYALLVRLLAGASEEALTRFEAADAPVAHDTLAYGIALWHRMNGRDGEARGVLVPLVGGRRSAAFGRIAAEVELGRL